MNMRIMTAKTRARPKSAAPSVIVARHRENHNQLFMYKSKKLERKTKRREKKSKMSRQEIHKEAMSVARRAVRNCVLCRDMRALDDFSPASFAWDQVSKDCHTQ